MPTKKENILKRWNEYFSEFLNKKMKEKTEIGGEKIPGHETNYYERSLESDTENENEKPVRPDDKLVEAWKCLR